MTLPPPTVRVLLELLVLTAAIYDLRWRRIPNWLNVAGIVAGFAANGVLAGTTGLKAAALGFGLALLVSLPLFALRLTGGGDVKLMAAVGALAGPVNWLAIFILSGILGGLFAILLVVWYGRVGGTLRNLGFLIWELAHLRRPYQAHEELDVTSPRSLRLPRGAVIALATLLFFAAVRMLPPLR